MLLNLFFNRPGGGHQWESPKQSARTGGANWSPSVSVSNYAPQQSMPTMVSKFVFV